MTTTAEAANRPQKATLSSCPYAAALAVDETRQGKDTTMDRQHGVRMTVDRPFEAIGNCPAFSSGTCPFKDAKSSEELRETLLKVPASHLEKSGQFFQVIQQMHQSVGRVDDEIYHVPGGCPVKQSVVSDMNKNISFTEALEGMSLSVIMARMASEHFGEDDSEQDDLTFPSAAVEETSSDQQFETDSSPVTNADLHHSLKKQRQRVSLSERLKTGTAVSHQDAENVHFVKNFAAGQIDRRLYGELVLQLYHVYEALEAFLEEQAPRHFASCHFPRELTRTNALAEDVDYWHGESVLQSHQLTPATRDYVERLEHISKTNPLLLLAHAYTRYLGDLSGGRVLARVARRAMHLEKNEGLAFYDFENISSPTAFKRIYRQAMDDLPLTPQQIKQLVAEANVAFCLNMRLFEELDVMAVVPGSFVRSLDDALAYADMTDDDFDQVDKGSEECPFLVKKKQQEQLHGKATTHKRCPWPFIFAHDAAQGIRDWQTWATIGLLLCWGWNMLQKKAVSQ